MTTEHSYLTDIEAWETAYSRAEEEIESEMGWTRHDCVGLPQSPEQEEDRPHIERCDWCREVYRLAVDNRFGGYL